MLELRHTMQRLTPLERRSWRPEVQRYIMEEMAVPGHCRECVNFCQKLNCCPLWAIATDTDGKHFPKEACEYHWTAEERLAERLENRGGGR